MWKYVSRGFRESVERGLGLTWTNGNRQEPTRQQRCSRFTSLCRTTSRSGVCATARLPHCHHTSQANQSSQSPPPNEEEPQSQSQEFAQNPKECILGAVSCSSALVLGWVLTQPYYHWRKWWSKEKCHLKSHCPLAGAILSSSIREPALACRFRLYDPLTSLLKGLNLVRLLPVSLAAPNNQAVLLAADHEETRPQEIQFGPLTAEEALDEAAEEVRTAHERATSVLENRRGVEAASRHRHAKAVALFRSASAKSYAPAQYNLAQCYELGLGTKQDFTQAAEWYKRAADLGHPGAMYNLAVFHAHGWGGLEADSTKARQLLVMAADKGQPDAMAALGYPGQSPPVAVMVDKEDLWGTPEQNDQVADESSDSYQHFSNNPIALYNLAQSFENSNNDNSPDPYLIMDLYKFASDLGHTAAKARLQILENYNAVGLLNEFFFLSKNKSGELCDADFLLDHH